MIDSFVVGSGAINIASGILLIVYWYAFAIFMPYRELSTTLSLLVKNRNWTWINVLGVLGALLGLLGQPAILVAQFETVSMVGVLGFFIASVGTVMLLGTMLWETVLWPILVRQDSSLLDFNGPIYRSKTFIPFFITAGLLYSAGYAMVGAAIMRAGVLPESAGLLIAIGAPTFGLGAMFGKYQAFVRSIGVTLLSAGLAWLGIAMLG
jgi:hypothetical protein